jgi:HTH-type transcriptional regulator / antitoxin HigA
MRIKPIHTKKDYQKALSRIKEIFDAKRGTPEGDELEVLSILVEKYEDKHFPIPAPDPVSVIKFRMEQMGYKQKDLAAIIGFKGRVSEILSKKRKLSLDMIRKLHEKLNIPLEYLVMEY